MEKRTAIIEYRVKVQQFAGGEKYVTYKKDIQRRDCNLRAHEHDYYNSDMFPSMLKHAHVAAVNGKEWCRLSALPDAVKVDTGGFLATSRVTVLV